MPDDRDRIKPHTPPAGVRAQTARPVNESFEEETPIEGDPVTQINTRAKNAAASSKASFAMIRELRGELKASVDRDLRDHTEMKDAMKSIDGRVLSVSEHVGNLREDMGEVRGVLHRLVNDLDADREERAETARIAAKAAADIEVASEKAKIRVDAAAKEAEIEDTKEIRKHKRIRVTKLITFLVAVGGAVVGLAHCAA